MGLIGAIEAGGTKFVLAVATPDGTPVKRGRLDTRGPHETLAEAGDWFATAQRELGPLSALGIASFGPIDTDPASPAYGTLSTTPKPGWSGIGYREALSHLAVPMAIDTDVNAAALGEWLHGAGRETRTLAYTTVGTGIGTGVVTNGEPLAGSSHYECGHIRPARPHGDDWAGTCPFHGDCLEGLASGPAILARWGADLSNLSHDCVDRVADYLGQLATTLVLVHMPDRLVFGGGVLKAPGLLDALRLKTRAGLGDYVAAWDGDLSARIVAPALGDDSGIRGAIELGRLAASRV